MRIPFGLRQNEVTFCLPHSIENIKFNQMMVDSYLMKTDDRTEQTCLCTRKNFRRDSSLCSNSFVGIFVVYDVAQNYYR